MMKRCFGFQVSAVLVASAVCNYVDVDDENVPDGKMNKCLTFVGV